MGCTTSSTTNNEVTDSTKVEHDNSFYTKDFYFPLEELKEGKVYEYVVVHNNETYLSHYWFLQSETAADGNNYLVWKRYNPKLEQDQFIREWVIKDGVITKEYKFYVEDSLSQTRKEYPNKVSQNVVFPFYASLDSVMAYRFVCEMRLPPDFLTVKLIRDRKFSESTRYSYEGKELDAIVFTSMDLYDIENKAEGGFWEQKRAVAEIYAKGIGLVYSEEKIAGEEQTEVTRLSKIYSIEAFEELKQRNKE